MTVVGSGFDEAGQALLGKGFQLGAQATAVLIVQLALKVAIGSRPRPHYGRQSTSSE